MKSKLVGQRLKMNNGLHATCIAFRDSSHIDVQFEDGTIVRDRSSSDFKAGKISCPSLSKNHSAKRSIVGLTVRMNNGMEATCIAYRRADDIDVQFEDGTVVQNKQKIHFLNGAISNPNYTPQSFPQRIIFECVSQYFPEAKYNFRPEFMRSSITGSKLEIDIWVPKHGFAIEYDGYPWHRKETRSAVEKARLFEDKSAVKTIFTFVEKGCVFHQGPKHENIALDFTSSSSAKTITQYCLALREHIVSILKQMGIENPQVDLSEESIDRMREGFSNSLIGKTVLMTNGMRASCIAYRRSDDIDVQFEDGTVVTRVNKQNFLAGHVANPVLGRGKGKEKDFTGISKIMNNGMEATIISCRNYYDIDVRFADGTLVEHTSKAQFDKKCIVNPSLGKRINAHRKASLEGRTVAMRSGYKATCIEDKGSTDLTIKFEDGEIVKHVSRGNFRKGLVAHPIFGGQANKKKQKASILGESRIMKNGMLATCVAYRNNHDLDIKFEDGAVAKHKTKNCFLSGSIRHPEQSTMIARVQKSSCVGITRKMNNGMLATCIEYRGSGDIDIQFADGTIVKGKRKSHFLQGNIGFPKK